MRAHLYRVVASTGIRTGCALLACVPGATLEGKPLKGNEVGHRSLFSLPFVCYNVRCHRVIVAHVPISLCCVPGPILRHGPGTRLPPVGVGGRERRGRPRQGNASMPRSPTPLASLSSAHFFFVHAGGGPLQRAGLDDLPGGGRTWLVSDGEGGKEKGSETRQDDHALLGSPVRIDRWVGRQEGG